MSTLIHKRVEAARRGENPYVICRVSSGWVVFGDVQFLKGYCLLLPDPVVSTLNDMDQMQRQTFLYEMSVVGDAVKEATGCSHLNYEMLGNLEPALHAHVFPRYVDEPEDLRVKPVWFYDWDNAPKFDAAVCGELGEKIKAGIEKRLKPPK